MVGPTFLSFRAVLFFLHKAYNRYMGTPTLVVPDSSSNLFDRMLKSGLTPRVIVCSVCGHAVNFDERTKLCTHLQELANSFREVIP